MRRVIKIFAIMAVAAIVILAAPVVTLLVRERIWLSNVNRSMDLAKQHASKVMPILQESRFTNVTLSIAGRLAGPLFVIGSVPTSNDLVDLQREIASTYPPVPITWKVVIGTNSTNELTNH